MSWNAWKICIKTWLDYFVVLIPKLPFIFSLKAKMHFDYADWLSNYLSVLRLKTFKNCSRKSLHLNLVVHDSISSHFIFKTVTIRLNPLLIFTKVYAYFNNYIQSRKLQIDPNGNVIGLFIMNVARILIIVCLSSPSYLLQSSYPL